MKGNGPNRLGLPGGANFTRAWRLYLAGSAASFTVGNLQLSQVVFVRSDDNAVPSTRDHIYTCR